MLSESDFLAWSDSDVEESDVEEPSTAVSQPKDPRQREFYQIHGEDLPDGSQIVVLDLTEREPNRKRPRSEMVAFLERLASSSTLEPSQDEQPSRKQSRRELPAASTPEVTERKRSRASSTPA